MAQQIREIRIKIDTKGDNSLRKISQSLKGVSRDVKETAKGMNFLKSAFQNIAGFSIAGIGLKGITNLSDEMQLLTNRIAVFEGSQEKALVTMDKLGETANETASSISDLAVIYNRLALALGDVGFSGDALLQLTKTLQNSFRLTGATAAEATGATIQLSQALASGQLRGQELRSVLEANAIIGDILAKQLGVTRGQLLKFSEKRGGISAEEFLSAVAKNMDEINKNASGLELTIGQTLLVVFNKLKVAANELNFELGISSGISKTILFLAQEALPLLITALGTLAVVKIPALVGSLTTLFTTLSLGTKTLAGLQLGLVLLSGGLAPLAGTAVIFAGIASAIYLVVSAVLDWDKTWRQFKIGFLLGVKQIIKGALFLNEALSKIPGTAVEKFTDSFKNKMEENLKSVNKSINTLFVEGQKNREKSSKNFIQEFLDGKKSIEGVVDTMAKLNALYLSRNISSKEYLVLLKKIKVAQVEGQFSKGLIDLEQRDKKIKEILTGVKESSNQSKNALAELNLEFLKSGNVDSYYTSLDSLNSIDLQKRFKEGSITLEQLNKELDTRQITEWNKAVAQGSLTLEEYNKNIRELNLKRLNEDFERGKVSVDEYHRSIVSLSDDLQPGSALYVGASDYIKSIGTVSSQVAGAITNVFRGLEDALFDFVKKGEFEFAKFTQAILDDLTRIIIRASIISPLANAITGSFGESNPSVKQSIQADKRAKGGVYRGNSVSAFASGGIVNSPTNFLYNGGRLGLMGEAGPEAIVPLRRTPQGDLGVQATTPNVNINIVNQTDAEIETRESTNQDGERVLEVLIVNKVKDAFAKGTFDKQLGAQYGLRRRGV